MADKRPWHPASKSWVIKLEIGTSETVGVIHDIRDTLLRLRRPDKQVVWATQ